MNRNINRQKIVGGVDAAAGEIGWQVEFDAIIANE